MSDKAIEAVVAVLRRYLDYHGPGEEPEIAQAAITAYLEAMREEGSVMVPVEPGGDMLAEGAEAVCCAYGCSYRTKCLCDLPERNIAERAYRAMIAAAAKAG